MEPNNSSMITTSNTNNQIKLNGTSTMYIKITIYMNARGIEMLKIFNKD